jgi:hypothetical protein
MGVHRIGDELRREAAPCERGAGGEGGGDAAHVAPPAQHVWGERHAGQRRQRGGERPTPDMLRGGLRGDGGEEAHPDDDRDDREHVARADALVERPRPEDEQEHEPEGERRLHDGQRRQQQRGGLERPSEQPERRAGEPPRAPSQAPDQRDAQPSRRRDHSRLERLQRNAEVVHQGGRTSGHGADDDRGHGSTPR